MPLRRAQGAAQTRGRATERRAHPGCPISRAPAAIGRSAAFKAKRQRLASDRAVAGDPAGVRTADARPEKARSAPRRDRSSGCSSAKWSLPSDPVSRARRSSAPPGDEPAFAGEGQRQRMAVGIALEGEAARARAGEGRGGGGEIDGAEMRRAQRQPPRTRRRAPHIGEPRGHGEAGRSRCALGGAGGEPRSGRREIEPLPASRRGKPGGQIEAAAERRAGKPRPAREIGQSAGQRALDQPGGEA